MAPKPGPSTDPRVDALLERLGIQVHGTQSGEIVAVCPWCAGNALNVNPAKSVWTCRKGCGGGNLFQLAAQVLKEKPAANQLLEECGFPRKGAKVTKLEGGKGKPVDAIGHLAEAKGAPREGFLRLGAEQVSERSYEVRIPMHDELGNVIGWSRCNPNAKDEALRKGRTAPGAQNGLFLERSALPKPGESICVVEGPKDAAWLLCNGYRAIGLPGCRLHPRFATVVAGCEVILVPDRDATARRSIEHNARAMVGLAASIRLAVLPFEETEKGGKDVRDAARELGVEAVHRAIRDARPWVPSNAERTRAVLHWDGVEIAERATEAAEILAAAALDNDRPPHVRVFAAPGGLARVFVEPEGLYLARLAKPIELVDALAGCTEWLKQGSRGSVSAVSPPQDVAAAIIHRGSGGFPRIEDIRRTPALRPDGTVVREPGYDASTASFSTFRAADYASIPARPTREHAEDSLGRLCDELFGEVHFRDAIADRYAGVAMFLTSCARRLFSKAPFFFVSANGRGAGKTVFCESTAWASTGRAPSAIPSLRSGEDELQKVMASHLASGASSILIDEAGGVVKSATLCALATQEQVNFRLLGSNDVPRLSTRVTLMATGNGLQPSSDLCRRVVTVHLEAGASAVGRRYERDIVDEARRRHPEWVSCGLTILSAWMQSPERKAIGESEPSYLRPCGFPTWSSIVRGALHWLTEADVAQSLFDAVAEDSDDEAFAGLLHTWRFEFADQAISCRELVQRSTTSEAIRDALALLGCAKGGVVDIQRVGNLLRARRGMHAGGYVLRQAERRTKNKAEPVQWLVEHEEGA